MRVVADLSLCEGHSVCESLVPEVFEVTDEDQVRLRLERPDGETLDMVRDAVLRCPKQALSVAND
jgi:ferredoxin